MTPNLGGHMGINMEDCLTDFLTKYIREVGFFTAMYIISMDIRSIRTLKY